MAGSSTSTATTSIPLWANTSTIPAPIVPSPITPTVEKSRVMSAILSEGRGSHDPSQRDAPYPRSGESPVVTAATSSTSMASRSWEGRGGIPTSVGTSNRSHNLEQHLVVGREDGPQPGCLVRCVPVLDLADLGPSRRSSRVMSTGGTGSGGRRPSNRRRSRSIRLIHGSSRASRGAVAGAPHRRTSEALTGGDEPCSGQHEEGIPGAEPALIVFTSRKSVRCPGRPGQWVG